MDKAKKSVRKAFIERESRRVERDLKQFEEAWEGLCFRLDAERPGWREDKLLVAKAKAVLRQEYNGVKHEGIVVMPSLS